MSTYESLSHAKWDCKYHMVFVPKRRKKTLYGKGRKFQIPSDLVVKSQTTDIIDVLLQLIRLTNGVHRSCHHRKSKGCGALNICSPVGYH